MIDTEGNDEATLRELARSLDCFTESELRTLAAATANTVAAWRKRRTGPPYVLFGRNFLYPRQAVAEYLQSKVRESGKATPAGGLL